MRRLSLMIGVLIVGLVLCRGSGQLVHAADYTLSGDSDCVAIGIWNAATKMCTLTVDIAGSIMIAADGITLDGNSHSITGPGIGAGNGIEIVGFRSNVTIKNVLVSGWQSGVNLYRAYATTIASSTIAANRV